MKTGVIATTIVLSLGAVTFALAQQGTGETPQKPGPAAVPARRSSDRPRPDQSELHEAIARLRAEVELLQLEHDLARERVSTALKERAGSNELTPSQQVARDYMRIGAELVDKEAEFEAAMQEKGDEIWRAVNRAIPIARPADIDQLKQDFLRIATALNRKKIDLVVQEVRLDGSM